MLIQFKFSSNKYALQTWDSHCCRNFRASTVVRLGGVFLRLACTNLGNKNKMSRTNRILTAMTMYLELELVLTMVVPGLFLRGNTMFSYCFDFSIVDPVASLSYFTNRDTTNKVVSFLFFDSWQEEGGGGVVVFVSVPYPQKQEKRSELGLTLRIGVSRT